MPNFMQTYAFSKFTPVVTIENVYRLKNWWLLDYLNEMVPLKNEMKNCVIDLFYPVTNKENDCDIIW